MGILSIATLRHRDPDLSEEQRRTFQ